MTLDWPRLHQQAQHKPHLAAVLALVGYTGLSIGQLFALEEQDVCLEAGWVHAGQAYYPLVQQAKALLRQHDWYQAVQAAAALPEALNVFDFDEVDAHADLVRAIWHSTEEGQILSEMSIYADMPAMPLSITYPFSVVDRIDPVSDPNMLEQSRATLQVAVDWLLLGEKPTSTLTFPWQKVLDGKFVFLIASTGVSGLNLLHNLVMGRLLRPEDYGQLTFFITLLLIVGLIPTAMQTVAARYGASYAVTQDDNALGRLLRYGRRWGLFVGLTIMGFVLLLQQPLAALFQIDNAALFWPVALGIPFFLMTGTDRGILQSRSQYYWLSAAYVAEGTIRLGLGVLLALALLDAGRALDGAVWAVGQSLLVTWAIAWVGLRATSKLTQTDEIALTEESLGWRKLFALTGLALLGQALITNSDFLLVKNYFDTFEAGLYAAVSVVGRIVYFGTLPITIIMVPMIARKQALGESTRTLFNLLIGGGAVLCLGLIGASVLFAPQILSLLYGDAYLDAASLLPPYTVAASLFVMTNLMVTYRIALGEGSETWMPLAAGVAQIIGIVLFHDSLLHVITVQVVVMSVLLAGVAWRARR